MITQPVSPQTLTSLASSESEDPKEEFALIRAPDFPEFFCAQDGLSMLSAKSSNPRVTNTIGMSGAIGPTGRNPCCTPKASLRDKILLSL
jgi:hypothetical protein